MEIINQPILPSRTALEVIEQELDSSSLSEFTFVVAWAKASGLRIIESRLENLKTKGIKSKIILGIDEGGATIEGLDLAIDLFDECYIYHNSTRGTFHPKIYQFSSDDSALMIGSSNLTFGGMSYNYETNIVLKSKDTGFSRANSDVLKYINSLLSDSACIYRIDHSNKSKIYSNPIYRVTSEKSKRGIRAVSTLPKIPKIFTGSSLPLSPIARRKILKPSATVNRPVTTPSPTPASRPTSLYRKKVSVVRRWVKKLPASDAQQVPAGTSPTGNIRLSKANNKIPFKTYFKSTFFSGLAWRPVKPTSPTMKSKEMADFDAHIHVDGIYYGKMLISVSYSIDRVSGQGNVPTVLHLKSLLPIFKVNNYTGAYISLELDSLNEYSIRINRNSSFIPLSIP